MSGKRRAVALDLTKPYHEYVKPDGSIGKASPTVDSLLRRRKAKEAQRKRVVIRHKREL